MSKKDKNCRFYEQKNTKYFFCEPNFSLLTFYFQKIKKGRNLYQKSKKIEILMVKGWNIQGGEFKSIVMENWRFFANGSGYC